jgi:hypothetical protein
VAVALVMSSFIQYDCDSAMDGWDDGGGGGDFHRTLSSLLKIGLLL